MVLPAALAFAQFEGWWQTLATLGLFLGLDVVAAYVVEPIVIGAKTGVSSMAMLVSAIFWAWLWGPVGLVLSTPLTVCLVVLGKHVPRLAFLGILLGDEPALEPNLVLYQRLLAGDEEEAQEILEKRFEVIPRAQVFDEVVIPALLLAAVIERDRKSARPTTSSWSEPRVRWSTAFRDRPTRRWTAEEGESPAAGRRSGCWVSRRAREPTESSGRCWRSYSTPSGSPSSQSGRLTWRLTSARTPRRRRRTSSVSFRSLRAVSLRRATSAAGYGPNCRSRPSWSFAPAFKERTAKVRRGSPQMAPPRRVHPRRRAPQGRAAPAASRSGHCRREHGPSPRGGGVARQMVNGTVTIVPSACME